MAIFHSNLEDRLQESYTIGDVVGTPFKSAWNDIFQDLNYEELFSGSKKRKSRLNDIAVFASFGLSSIPHELIHATVNNVTGGTNEKIVINSFFGGDLVSKVYSGIDAEFILPIFGGYVKIGEYGSFLGELATSVSPYAMTPIGIYLVSEGKKRKSLPLAIAGSGALISHAGAIIGDFFKTGRTIMDEAANFVADSMGYSNFEVDDSWMAFPLALAGFYIGSKLLSFSYRLSKAGVNHCRNPIENNR